MKPEMFNETEKTFNKIVSSIRISPIQYNCIFTVLSHEITKHIKNCKYGYAFDFSNVFDWVGYGLGENIGEIAGPLRVIDSHQHKDASMQLDIAVLDVENRELTKEIIDDIRKQIMGRPWLREINDDVGADWGCILGDPCPKFQEAHTQTKVEFRKVGSVLIAFIFTHTSEAQKPLEVFNGILDSLEFDPVLLVENHTLLESKNEQKSKSTFIGTSSNYFQSNNQKMYNRVCPRVFQRFLGNDKMMTRVNDRLKRRFGFVCTK